MLLIYDEQFLSNQIQQLSLEECVMNLIPLIVICSCQTNPGKRFAEIVLRTFATSHMNY